MFTTDIQCDLYRISGKTDLASFLNCILRCPGFRVLYYHRLLVQKKGIIRLGVRMLNRSLQKRMHININHYDRIGFNKKYRRATDWK